MWPFKKQFWKEINREFLRQERDKDGDLFNVFVVFYAEVFTGKTKVKEVREFTMKTIIAGGREGISYLDVEEAIKKCGWIPSEVVCGEARGSDAFGKMWAQSKDIPVISFPAKWNDLSHPDAIIKTNSFGKKYDARAGIRRNHEMGDYADALIAVWDKKSKGTADMIDYATKKGLKVFVHIPLRYKMNLDNN